MAIGLKEKIKEAIDNSDDEQFLSIVYSMIENYNHNGVIGFDPKGKAYTKVSLLKELDEDSQEMDKGNYISAEEMKKRVASWR